MDKNRQDGYLAQSWALLTRDRGWIKPVLVLAVAQFVPIVGALGMNGYALEWARLTAWGVDSSPKQRGVRVGACIASGWRGLIAMLGWSAVITLVAAILGTMLKFIGLSWLVSLAASVLSATVGGVVALRATIYQRIGAGYAVRRVVEMMRADPRGLVRVAGLTLALSLASGLVIGLVAAVTLVPVVSQLAFSACGYGLFDSYGATSNEVARWLATALSGSLGTIALGVVAIAFVANVAMVLVTLLTDTATGLWMRQFDVPAWGDSDDPLPAGVGGGAAAGEDGAAPYAGGLPAQGDAWVGGAGGGSVDRPVDPYAVPTDVSAGPVGAAPVGWPGDANLAPAPAASVEPAAWPGEVAAVVGGVAPDQGGVASASDVLPAWPGAEGSAAADDTPATWPESEGGVTEPTAVGAQAAGELVVPAREARESSGDAAGYGAAEPLGEVVPAPAAAGDAFSAWPEASDGVAQDGGAAVVDGFVPAPVVPVVPDAAAGGDETAPAPSADAPIGHVPAEMPSVGVGEAVVPEVGELADAAPAAASADAPIGHVPATDD